MQSLPGTKSCRSTGESVVDVSAITSTGFRPEAFELCIRWMQRQNVDGLSVQWVIIDDEKRQSGAQIGRRVPFPSVLSVPGFDGSCSCTMPINLHDGVGYCEGDVIVFIEDDDWYHPDYLRVMHRAVYEREVAIAGVAEGRYYHVGNPNASDYRYNQPSYWERYSDTYASLCRTAISRRKSVNRLREICWACHSIQADKVDVSVDLRLWGSTPADDGRHMLDDPELTVSIKGLPGRKGAGSLHSRPLKNRDPNWSKLREWIGEDTDLYREVIMA